jgi:DNA polymerase I-like protein with 3'-5' exonuclease and polymerase domains
VSLTDRQRAKTMVYGVIYGMGAAKMASDLGSKRGSAG